MFSNMFPEKKKSFKITFLVVYIIVFVLLVVAGYILITQHNKTNTNLYELNLFSVPSNAALYLESYDSNSQPSGITKESAKYLENTEIIVTTNVIPGYVFENWKDSKGVVVSSDLNHTFLMPAKNISLYAHFKSFTQETASLSLDINVSNTGSVEGAGDYFPGDKITVKATPDTNFIFDNWKDSLGRVISYSPIYVFIMPDKNYSLTANFKSNEKKYTLSLLTYPLNKGNTNGTGNYLANQNVSVSATPIQGYKFKEWRASSQIVSSSSTYTFKMPAKDYVLTAHFEIDLPKHTLSLLATPQGKGTLTGDGNYHVNEDVTITAVPNKGYVFDYWKDSSEKIISRKPIYTFKMLDNNYTLKAYFSSSSSSGKTRHTLSLKVDPPGKGNVSGSGNYYKDQNVALTAIPVPGYEFKNWTDVDGNVISEDSNFSILMPAKNYTLTANFEGEDPDVTIYKLSLYADPPGKGGVEGGGNYAAGAQANINATPVLGYKFEKWVGSDGNVITSASYELTMPSHDYNLTAHFIEEETPPQTYNLNLLVEPSGVGEVSGGGVKEAGQDVTVQATPYNGYVFKNWTDSLGEVSKEANYNFIMPAKNYTLIAHFEEEETPSPTKYHLTLVPNPSEGGTVTGEGDYEEGDEIPIFANASIGYVFEKWVGSDGNVITSASYELTMPGHDYNLTAHFIEEETPPQTYNLNLLVEPSGVGEVSGGGVKEAGQDVTVQATAYNGYVFKNWTDSSGVKSYDENYTFSMPANDYELTAHFEDITPPTYELTLLVEPSGAGEVTGGGVYLAGENVTAKAIAFEGYNFKNWSDSSGVKSYDENYTFSMPAKNYTLTAHFIEEETPSPTKFISTWDTRNVMNAGDRDDQVTLPLVSNGTYDFDVNWGDDKPIEQITNQNYTTKKTHTYDVPGEYTITITGTINGFSFKNCENETLKIINISNWGPLNLGNTGFYFKNAENLNITATDILDLEGTTNLMYMFNNNKNLIFNNSINNWDVSNVTKMELMFADASSFNQDLNDWVVSSVTNMKSMFAGATSFNKSLNDWDVSNVTDTSFMFKGATSFNKPLNDWNVLNVTNMSNMFNGASSFNKELNKWDVSNVTDMNSMFNKASSFNQSLASWEPISTQLMMDILKDTSLSTANYDALLNSWVEKELKQNVLFSAHPTKYSAAGENARLTLMDEGKFNWTIVDGGIEQGQIKYNLHIDVEPEGAGICTGEGEYFAGHSFTIHAEPKDGYTFDKWTDSQGNFISSNPSYEITMPEHDLHLIAKFIQDTPPTYNLTLLVEPSGAGEVTGGGAYLAGENVSAKATAFEGYNFKNWSDSSGVKSYDENYTFSMPANDYALTAYFEEIILPTYNLTLSVDPSGAGEVTGGGVYLAGENVSAKATAFEGYNFKNWSDSSGVKSYDENYTFSMPASNYALTAHFEEEATPPTPGSEFISTWDTRNVKNASDPNNKVTLPLTGGNYDFDVNWGDGTPIKQITTQNYNTQKTHAYATPGVYTITITGTIKGFSFKNYANESNKILDISQWGSLNLGNSDSYFSDTRNLNITATDILDLDETTNLVYMFNGAENLIFNNSINLWDVSNVTDMSWMFWGATSFNQPLNNWNVSNVATMKGMFGGATSFNQSLANWNVSNVTDMSWMFFNASSFNQELNDWNVSKVTDMTAMLYGVASFNQPLNDWNISNVTDMRYMFCNAKSFNQELNDWNVSNVSDMLGMFYYATNFNRPLNTWNTSNVTYMNIMFAEATSFNQSLANWNVSNVVDMEGMLDNTNLSTANYDLILNSWAYKNVKHNVNFGVGNTKYSSAAATARNRLENEFEWIISDGGPTGN